MRIENHDNLTCILCIIVDSNVLLGQQKWLDPEWAEPGLVVAVDRGFEYTSQGQIVADEGLHNTELHLAFD